MLLHQNFCNDLEFFIIKMALVKLDIVVIYEGVNYIYLRIRAVATAPEKTPTEKVKFSELRDHHQSIPRQILP